MTRQSQRTETFTEPKRNAIFYNETFYLNLAAKPIRRVAASLNAIARDSASLRCAPRVHAKDNSNFALTFALIGEPAAHSEPSAEEATDNHDVGALLLTHVTPESLEV